MVLTIKEIEAEVSQLSGTWIKRRNLRNKLIEKSNSDVLRRINIIKKEIRSLKADGFNEYDLRALYSNVTNLELQVL